MSYSVEVRSICADGFSVESHMMQVATSEREAFEFARDAIEKARSVPIPMQFNVYGPGNRLLMSYTNEAKRSPQLDVLVS